MKSEEAQFVVQHYYRLMTKYEKFAYKQLRARAGRRESFTDRENTQGNSAFPGLVTDDPELLELMKGGYEVFVERTAGRIRSAHPTDVVVNRCPRCHELARTPKAQQCRSCFFDWHSTKSDRL